MTTVVDMKFRNHLCKCSLWCPLAFFLLLFLVGCKPGVPRKYLSPHKMEAILYDFHVAKGMADISGNYQDTLQMSVYQKAVLKKHGVSQADYDSSMVYYMRHTGELKTIYEHLADRLDAEAKAMGAVVGGAPQLMTLSVDGDTANIWAADRSFVLMQHPAFNSYSFRMEADSTFRAGDRFVFTFDTEFVFQDGTRDAIASLAIRLSNDSIISRMVRMSSSSEYRIDVTAPDGLEIKSLYGYFVLNRRLVGEPDSRTTIKLLHVGGIKLIRMHSKHEVKEESADPKLVEKSDSDSLAMRPHQADTLGKRIQRVPPKQLNERVPSQTTQ